VGAGDPAVQPDVRDPVGVVDVAQRSGQDRLGQVQAPAAVRGEGGVQRLQQPVVVEADPPPGVEPVSLAGHRDVLGASEPDAHGAAGDDGTERRDRGVPVRLHLLAAEGPTHPQRLHGDLVGAAAEHVRDDLLGLRGVLGAALHEDLTGLVDVRQGALRLEVEVLLARHLGDAAEHVGRRCEAALHVAALDGGLGALEAPRGDRLGDAEDRGQRLVVDLDGGGAETCGLERLAQDPAHRVADVADLAGEQRLVVSHPGVVAARHVVGREHPDDAGDLERGGRAEGGHASVRMRRLHRVGVQASGHPDDEVVGEERGARDVEGGALVGHLEADDGIGGTRRQGTHASTSLSPARCVVAHSLSSDCSSIAAR